MNLIQRLVWLPAMLHFGLMWEIARPAFLRGKIAELRYRAKWVVAADRNCGYWTYPPVEVSRYVQPEGPSGPTWQVYKLKSRWINW